LPPPETVRPKTSPPPEAYDVENYKTLSPDVVRNALKHWSRINPAMIPGENKELSGSSFSRVKAITAIAEIRSCERPRSI